MNLAEPDQDFGLQLMRIALAVGLLAMGFVALAADQQPAVESPDWLQVGLGLFGGLALFLAGLQLLSEGMKKAAGQTMTRILAELTTNRIKGALTGAFVTGILNRTFRTPPASFRGVFRRTYPSLGCWVKQLTGTSSASRNASCVSVKGLLNMRWPSMQRTRIPLNFHVIM